MNVPLGYITNKNVNIYSVFDKKYNLIGPHSSLLALFLVFR